MKPTFVIPWYGVDVTGGAETEARKTVEGLQRLAGLEVEVLTTCMQDFHSDWSVNSRPEGLEWVDGIPIIEHVPLDELITLLDETVRVLTSGGVAIFETPNPRNVLVGSHTFYLDPTHRNPLPSAVMQFLAEARGLCRVEILELHPCPKAAHVQDAELDVAKRFNEYFYGPQDYAVIGWKV